MDLRLRLRVQRSGWDRAAPYYERFWRPQLEPAQARLLALAALRPGERVLDVACGTGLIAFPAAEAVKPTGQVVATDISEEMVAIVRREAERRGFPTLHAERAEAEDLPFTDGSFDVVLCGLGLMYVSDPIIALREMLRVLDTRGRMVAAVWGAREKCGWAEVFPIVDARVQSEVCPLFFQLGTDDSLLWTAGAAGFADLVSERITTTLYYDSDRDAVGAAFIGGPVALAYSRFDAATRNQVHAEYLASIASYRDPGGRYRIPGEFVVVRGRKP